MRTEFEQVRGDLPTVPDAVEVALEAGVDKDRAVAVIAASWAMAEAWTGRNYYPVLEATAVVHMDCEGVARWPRRPAPEAVTVQSWNAGGWGSWDRSSYFMGEVEDLPRGRNRITQVGAVTPAAPPAHVVEAVRNLALYQLIQSPTRREFRSIGAGDGTLTRETVDSLLRGSGAGQLLASEVIW